MAKTRGRGRGSQSTAPGVNPPNGGASGDKLSAITANDKNDQTETPQTTKKPFSIAKYDASVKWAGLELERGYPEDDRQVNAFHKNTPAKHWALSQLQSWLQKAGDRDREILRRYAQLQILGILRFSGYHGSQLDDIYDNEWRQLDVNGYPLPREIKKREADEVYESSTEMILQRHAVLLGTPVFLSGRDISITSTGDHSVQYHRYWWRQEPSALETKLKTLDKNYRYESESDCEDDYFRRRTQPRNYASKIRTGALATYLNGRTAMLRKTPFGQEFTGKKRTHPGPCGTGWSITPASKRQKVLEQDSPRSRPSSSPRQGSAYTAHESGPEPVRVFERGHSAVDFGDDELTHIRCAAENDWWQAIDSASEPLPDLPGDPMDISPFSSPPAVTFTSDAISTPLAPEKLSHRAANHSPFFGRKGRSAGVSRSTLSSATDIWMDNALRDLVEFELENIHLNVTRFDPRAESQRSSDIPALRSDSEDDVVLINEDDDVLAIDFGDDGLADLETSAPGNDVWYRAEDRADRLEAAVS